MDSLHPIPAFEEEEQFGRCDPRLDSV